MGIVDQRVKLAGLCPTANRYGTEKLARIRTCIESLYQVTDLLTCALLDKVGQLYYFVRGGPFLSFT
jgi:hypothetical protein